MLSGTTLSAAATVGTAVFRMVVSSASMKKATATSHGRSRLTDSSGEDRGGIGWSNRPRLHHRDLHAVDRRERVEQAVPLLAAVPSDPELSRRGAEVERRRLELVDVHRVAQDREEALLLRQTAGEPPPRAAAVLAAPDGGDAARTGARRRLERHDVDRVGILRMDDHREAEVGRQALGDRAPRLAVIVTAQHADIRSTPAGAVPFGPAAVVLHVEPPGSVLVPRDLVHALAELGIRIGREARA